MSQVLNLINKLCISVFELLPSADAEGLRGLKPAAFTTDLACVTLFNAWAVEV